MFTNSKILGYTFITNGLMLNAHCIYTKQSKPIQRVKCSPRSFLQGAEAIRGKIQSSSRVRFACQKLSYLATAYAALILGYRCTVGAEAGKGACESLQLRSLAIKSVALNDPNRNLRKWFGERPPTVQNAKCSLERLYDASLLNYWVRYSATYLGLSKQYCSSRWKRAY
ncbi:hypothetical protein MP228_006056 [Amoeboaphelidium protococcarum]|nr:hypothetical protein MP228_006056 [Amoeboaphelidium protococcarum]